MRAAVAASLARSGVNGKILIGFSGGPDSTALLLILRQLLTNPADLCAAHLNHGLRPEAATDAAWAAEFCAQRNIPLISSQRDVAQVADEQRLTLEEAARHVRYGFLKSAAEEVGAGWVAVAHTADDQAETVLHHLIRGTGWAGLLGMAEHQPLISLTTDRALPGSASEESRIRLIRPTLLCRRADLCGLLSMAGVTARHDASNDDPQFTRNRLRQQLMPVLKEFNPRVVNALTRLQQQTSEWYAMAQSLAATALDAALLAQQVDAVRLHLGRLRTLPLPVLRECFVELWRRQSWPRQRMSSRHWNQLADVCRAEFAADATGTFDLPGGIRVQRQEEILRLIRISNS